ncbi:MAG: hypothetical protein M1839_000659 [Geoglossum umbratile]|nr:MAG: hypothetical protein M1839_000659 [Geoglossum umbratile]
MSVSDRLSTLSRRFSTASAQKWYEDRNDFDYDLITVLAVAQTLNLFILPLTLPPAENAVEKGASSKVHFALMKPDVDFAFKRVRRNRHTNAWQRKALYRTLVNEISAFASPGIGSKKFVANIEAMCWDVSEDDNEVWPALAFKRSPLGDLDDFLTQEAGRNLSTFTRLELIIGIAEGLCDMWSAGIIHGDVKPSNILVFQTSGGRPPFTYAPMIIDCGYSLFANSEEDTKIHGRSYPWCAPELEAIEDSQANLDAALVAEVFSFGMTSMWILFEKYLASLELLPGEAAIWARECFPQSRDRSTSKVVLGNLKRKKFLYRFLTSVIEIMDDGDLAVEVRGRLLNFLTPMLQQSPEDRFPNSEYDSESYKTREAQSNAVWTSPFHRKFEIAKWIEPLYYSDYRVRKAIRTELEQKVKASTPNVQRDDGYQHLAFQLAICLKIGFGGSRNNISSLEFLAKSGMTDEELDEAVSSLHGWPNSREAQLSSDYENLMELYPIHEEDLAARYCQPLKVDEAEARIREEINDLTSSGGNESRLVAILNSTLARVLAARGKPQEAEQLLLQTINLQDKFLGLSSLANVVDRDKLSMLYWRQARREESEALQRVVLDTLISSPADWDYTKGSPSTVPNEIALLYVAKMQRLTQGGLNDGQTRSTRMQELSFDNPEIFSALNYLASIYQENGEMKAATHHAKMALEGQSSLLGRDHPDTLVSMDNLSRILYANSVTLHLNEAEDVGIETFERRTRVLGPHHPDTLNTMGMLVGIYQKNGRLDKAEELGVELVDIREQLHGPEDPTTLRAMNRLGTIRRDLNSFEEAANIGEQVLQCQKRTLGDDHLDTLMTMDDLVLTYIENERRQEAEALGMEVRERRSRILGPRHRLTFLSIRNLGALYFNWQGKTEKAEDIFAAAYKGLKEILGEEHPDTFWAMWNLATTYRRLGRLRDGIDLMQRSSKSVEPPLRSIAHDICKKWTEEQVDMLEAAGLVTRPHRRPACETPELSLIERYTLGVGY